MALSNNGGKKVNSERELVKTAQDMTTGVFACDFWNVFSDVPLQLKHAPNGHAKVVDYTKVHYSNGTAVQRPNTKIFVNTLLFVNVWKYIKHQPTWKYIKHQYFKAYSPPFRLGSLDFYL